MRASNWLISANCLLGPNGPKKDAVRFLHTLISSKTPFLILTNRSGRSPEGLCTSFTEAGFKGVRPEMFFTSIMAAIDYAAHVRPEAQTAGYIGGESVRTLLKRAGYAVDLDEADWLFIADDRNATFNDYSYALRLLQGKAEMIAADASLTYEASVGTVLGPGAVAGMLREVSGKEPIFTGMPSSIMIERALAYMDAPKETAILVGCEPESDIRAGNSAGIETVYILPEGTDYDTVFGVQDKPTYMIKDLSGLLR